MFFVPAAFNIIAREIIALLLERGHDVRGMLLSAEEEQDVRNFLKFRRIDDRRFTCVHGPFHDLDTFARGLEGCEKVFFSTDNFPGFEASMAGAIDLIGEAAPSHVVMVSFDQAGPDAPYELGRAMGRLEDRLKATGVPFTILRGLPFMLMQNVRAHATSIQRRGVFALPFANERIAILDCRDIAVAGARVFRTEEAIGRTYRLTGPEALTCWEMAGELTMTLGYPVRYARISTAETTSQMLNMRMPAPHVQDFVGLFEQGAQGFLGEVSGDFEELMGRPGRTFEGFVNDYRWAFARGEEEGQLSGWLNYAN